MIKKNEFGKELKVYLDKEDDIVKISRWAFKIYSENIRYFDPSMRDILECLFSMEDEPQFEYTIPELKLLAEMLINEENDPIIKLNELKRRGSQ